MSHFPSFEDLFLANALSGKSRNGNSRRGNSLNDNLNRALGINPEDNPLAAATGSVAAMQRELAFMNNVLGIDNPVTISYPFSPISPVTVVTQTTIPGTTSWKPNPNHPDEAFPAAVKRRHNPFANLVLGIFYDKSCHTHFPRDKKKICDTSFFTSFVFALLFAADANNMMDFVNWITALIDHPTYNLSEHAGDDVIVDRLVTITVILYGQ